MADILQDALGAIFGTTGYTTGNIITKGLGNSANAAVQSISHPITTGTIDTVTPPPPPQPTAQQTAIAQANAAIARQQQAQALIQSQLQAAQTLTATAPTAAIAQANAAIARQQQAQALVQSQLQAAQTLTNTTTPVSSGSAVADIPGIVAPSSPQLVTSGLDPTALSFQATTQSTGSQNLYTGATPSGLDPTVATTTTTSSDYTPLIIVGGLAALAMFASQK
jgi:hypothetical protein